MFGCGTWRRVGLAHIYVQTCGSNVLPPVSLSYSEILVNNPENSDLQRNRRPDVLQFSQVL